MAAGKPKKFNACPHCHARGIVEEISTRDEKFGAVPSVIIDGTMIEIQRSESILRSMTWQRYEK